jgi:hypothetical protein
MQTYLDQNGPMSSRITTCSDFWAYKEGTFSEETCNDMGSEEVTIIGYDQTNLLWKIRVEDASWGTEGVGNIAMVSTAAGKTAGIIRI